MRDPYDPADAIFAAARYLRAAGAAQSLTGAIYAYNHSGLYVESVMLRARLLAGIPPALLTALTAIGQGHVALGLAPAQLHKLMRRLAELPQPRMPLTPTNASLPDRPGGVDLPPPAPAGAPAPTLALAPQAAAGFGASGSGAPAGGGFGRAASSPASGGLSFQPELGLPAEAVNMVGAAPTEEAGGPGVAWATGVIGAVPASVGAQQLAAHTKVLLRHAQGAGGWQMVPVQDAQGRALAWSGTPSVTASGGMAMQSTVEVLEGEGEEAKKKTLETLVAREPGGAFVQAPPPPSGKEKALEGSEILYPKASQGQPIFTAIDEAERAGAPAGHTGALIAPAGASSLTGIAHYDGAQWTREPICTQYTGGVCSDGAGSLKALAIASAGTRGEPVPSAWLLGSSEGELMLFKRTAAASGPPVWVRSEPASWAPSPDKVSPREKGQMLTVTSQGVWVDAALSSPSAPNAKADLSVLVDASAPTTILCSRRLPATRLRSGLARRAPARRVPQLRLARRGRGGSRHAHRRGSGQRRAASLPGGRRF